MFSSLGAQSYQVEMRIEKAFTVNLFTTSTPKSHFNPEASQGQSFTAFLNKFIVHRQHVSLTFIEWTLIYLGTLHRLSFHGMTTTAYFNISSILIIKDSLLLGFSPSSCRNFRNWHCNPGWTARHNQYTNQLPIHFNH